jgi:hypothetical protein
VRFERLGANAFAKVVLEPTAQVDKTKLMLIMLVDNDSLPTRPPLESVSEGKKKMKKP